MKSEHRKTIMAILNEWYDELCTQADVDGVMETTRDIEILKGAMDELEAMPPTSTELLQSLDDHPAAENAVAVHGVAHNIAKLMGVVKKKALAVAQADIPAGLVGKLEFAGGNCGYKKPGVKFDAEKWELWKAKDTELQAAEDAYNQAAEVAKQAKFRLDEVQAPFYIRQGRGQFYINNNTKRGKVS